VHAQALAQIVCACLARVRGLSACSGARLDRVRVHGTGAKAQYVLRRSIRGCARTGRSIELSKVLATVLMLGFISRECRSMVCPNSWARVSLHATIGSLFFHAQLLQSVPVGTLEHLTAKSPRHFGQRRTQSSESLKYLCVTAQSLCQCLFACRCARSLSLCRCLRTASSRRRSTARR
jgi:hypothetical protein